MSNNLKKFKKLAREVRLSASDKSAMRGELLRYMEMHPVRDGNSLRALAVSNVTRPTKKEYRVMPSPFFSMQSFRKNRILPVFITLGLVMGGSVSFAAEKTLPGDLLYPVKVHLNENVRGGMAITSKAKADWGVQLVVRRIREAEAFALTPGVSPETREVAQKNLEHYTKKVEAHINKLENNKEYNRALVTSLKLASTFKAHEKTLENISMSSQTTEENFSASDISTNMEKVRDARYRAEARHEELKSKYESRSNDGSILNEAALLNDLRGTIPFIEKKRNQERGIIPENKKQIKVEELRSVKPAMDDTIMQR